MAAWASVNERKQIIKDSIFVIYKKDIPGNSLHQNLGKNRRQALASEQHDPQKCPTRDDQERFVEGPASKKHIQITNLAIPNLK